MHIQIYTPIHIPCLALLVMGVLEISTASMRCIRFEYSIPKKKVSSRYSFSFH